MEKNLLTFEDRKILAMEAIETASRETIRKYVNHARTYYKTYYNDDKRRQLFSDLKDYINENAWDKPQSNACFAEEWRKGWKYVLSETKEAVLSFRNTSVTEGFKDSAWKTLEPLLGDSPLTAQKNTADCSNKVQQPNP